MCAPIKLMASNYLIWRMFQDALREAVCEDYLSALEDLTFNSKHYINMLTKLAKDNLYFAKDIVATVEAHIAKAPATEKLPVLYLVDSIVKNVKGDYVEFSKNITTSFISVFEKVDCDTRKSLRRLRNTWDDAFPLETLYTLDMRVKCIDPNWPVKSVQPTVDSNFPLNPNLQQPAVNQLGLTDVNKRELRQKQQHEKAPVKKDEETELNPKISCADSEERDAASVSEHRSTGHAGELERGLKLGLVNGKKRFCSRSPPALLPLSKRKDSSSPESRPAVTFSSSAKCRNGKQAACRDFPLHANAKDEKTVPTSNTSDTFVRCLPLEGAKDKHLKQFEEDLSHVTSDPQCVTRLEWELMTIDKKKRIFSGSLSPLLPLSKGKDSCSPDRSPDFILSSPANSGDGTQAKGTYFSQLTSVDETTPLKNASDTERVIRSLEDGAMQLTTKTHTGEWEELQCLKQPGESLPNVMLDACLTKLASPLCQRCPPRLYSPPNPQNHLRRGPPVLISLRRRDHDGRRHMPYTTWPPRRMQTPAHVFGDAPQYQVQQSTFHGANFTRLLVAGAPTISQQTPLVHFYNPGALAPSIGNMKAPVPAGTVHQGMNARPGFGMTWPAVPSYCQLQPFIASAQNTALLNQPGLQFESRASHSGQMNVNSLVTKLISSGLIKTTMTAPTKAFKTESVSEKQEKDNVQKVPDLTGFVKEDMKKRYNGVVAELYAGQQCSSCGQRFGSSHTQEYRAHLDWHYRQNRSKKDSRSRGAHRGWYCSGRDWTEHDDSAYLKESAKKSWFFEQAHEVKVQGEERKRDLYSVRAAVDVVDESCEICRELFDLTWEDEREQWCLKNAIRFDGKTYHPSCYEDYKNTL